MRADVSTAQARAALSALTGLTTLSVPGAGLTDTAPLGPPPRTPEPFDGRRSRLESDSRHLVAFGPCEPPESGPERQSDHGLSPLVANVSLGYGTGIAIEGNPIDCTTQAENIATLRARGVTLSTDCP